MRTVTLITLLVLSCGFLHPQQSTPPPRRKIGLVLEGGSALGLAHIGVLRWLEEHHIPIGYVAGTSMGALIGGIYSTGQSPEELQKLVETINWDELLRGQIPYKNLSFRRKEDALEYPNRMEFGLKKGFRFPEGFNPGQQVTSILDRAALPYSEVQNFDELPTPFACVAADLVNSEKYVFRQGSLSLALRSSMSLPGIFTPVRWQGHIFVDGGLLDNLPVDVAKSLGADLTIAVHLETTKLEPTATLSSLNVLANSTGVVIAANELKSIEQADIVISVPLQKFGSLDFENFQEIIQAGYDAAEAKARILETLSVDETSWREHLADRAGRRRTAPEPEFVQVVGTNPRLDKALEGDLQAYAGKPIDTEHLENQLSQLLGEGRLASLSYEMTSRNEQNGLLITATEKPYSPPIVQPLLLLEGSNFAGPSFTMGARITFTDFGSYRTELRNDIMIGAEYRLASQYFHPFSATSKWFVAPNVVADYREYPFYKREEFLAQFRKTSVGGGMDAGYQFGRVAQLSLGYTAEYQQFAPKIGDTTLLPNVSGRFGATTLRFSLNALDNPVIPRSGEYAILSGSWVDSNPGAAHSYPLAEGTVYKFIQLDNPSSIYFGAHGGTSFGNELVGVPAFELGGTNVFSAYGQNELLTNQYYQFQAGYLRRLVRIPVLLGDAVYLDGVAEVGKVFGPPFNSLVPADGAVALVINTIFGPLKVGAAAGATGHRRVFIQLGRIF